jgi:enoyl-CoA hydratase
MSANLIKIEQPAPGITVVELNRPDQMNACTVEMIMALRAALTAVDADPECRVVVLASAGGNFCAGLDLKEITGAQVPNTAIQAMALQEAFAGTPGLMRRIRQPIVAAVQGAAVGAGFALALAADVRLASASAKFLIGAVRIGLTAGETGISYHLPRIIGAGRAFEIMLTGRPVLAAEAQAIGLVTQVTEAAELRDAAVETARAIAENAPYATKHTKQLMWTNLEAPSLDAALQLENHVQTVAMLSHDFAEATQAFLEKRPPRFTGG